MKLFRNCNNAQMCASSVYNISRLCKDFFFFFPYHPNFLKYLELKRPTKAEQSPLVVKLKNDKFEEGEKKMLAKS